MAFIGSISSFSLWTELMPILSDGGKGQSTGHAVVKLLDSLGFQML